MKGGFIMKYIFNDVVYETIEQAEDAVDNYARDIFDDYLDETYGNIDVAGLNYPCSQVFESVDPIAYRVALSDFSNALLADIKTI